MRTKEEVINEWMATDYYGSGVNSYQYKIFLEVFIDIRDALNKITNPSTNINVESKRHYYDGNAHS